MMNKRQAPADGFTLVELLVVIGIIALLISILLPGLNKARSQASMIKCASNLRNIGQGFQIYANANRGTCIPGRMPSTATNVYYVGNGNVFRPRWFVTMGGSAGFFAFTDPPPLDVDASNDNSRRVTNPVFLCPTEFERDNNRNFTYGYNHQFLGNARNKVGTPSGGWRPINFPVRITSIRAASTVIVADAMGTAAGKPSAMRTAYRQDGGGDLSAVGNHAWSLDPPRVTSLSDYCDDNNRQPQHRSGPDPRHNKTANFLFADGHVESMSPKDAGYVVNADGSFAKGDGTDGAARASNRLFSGKNEDIDPPLIQ